MITLKNIVKGFGDKIVLQDVSAVFETGKTNLIIGTSGSGKTVMMKVMVGLMQPDRGEVLYGDRNIVTMDKADLKEIRTQVGMLFQGNALFDSRTVEENVIFPLEMFSRGTRTEMKRRVNEVLHRVNLMDAHKKFPAEISGGMKKRVALARALVLNPKYLFCDEPNSGLDPKTSLVIDKLIKELTYEYNITTVINTHDMNTVMESGDKIIYMHHGKKRWEGNSQQIIKSTDQDLNDFIFASDFLRQAKEARMEEGVARDKL